MYSRYNRCCGQYQTNPALETICDDINTTNNMPCNCGCCQMDNSENCGCGFDEQTNLFPTNPMLAQSYVPIQYMDKTFTPCCGLKMGTIFPELVSPYAPGQSMREIDYLRARNEIGEGCNG